MAKKQRKLPPRPESGSPIRPVASITEVRLVLGGPSDNIPERPFIIIIMANAPMTTTDEWPRLDPRLDP